MKKFTLSFMLFAAMFTTAMAQEAVDLTTGTFSGIEGNKSTYSQWTSTNGVTIVAKDANGNDIGSMKVYNGFRLAINSGVATPISYTISVPEGYTLTEMKFENGSKSFATSVEYGSTNYDLKGNTDEQTITFTESDTSFKLNGTNDGREHIYINALTMTKDASEGGEDGNEGEGEGNEGEGGTQTSVEKVEAANEATVIYNLSGRQVEEITEAGIYIVNGVKVLVK